MTAKRWAALILAILVLAGGGAYLIYGNNDPVPTPAIDSPAGYTGTGTATLVPATPTVDPITANDGRQLLGSSYTWIGTQITVSIGKPEPFKPSASATGVTRTDGNHNLQRVIVFPVEVNNKSVTPLDMNDFELRGTFDGRELFGIVDYEKQVTGTPHLKLRPGGITRYRVAVGVGNSAGDLELQVTPRPYDETIYFGGKV